MNNTKTIGIDWADVEHVFHIIDETGNEQTGILLMVTRIPLTC